MKKCLNKKKGLRPLEASVLPGLGCHSHVLWHRQSGQFGEHHRKVATRSASLLSARSRGARGQQEGLAQRRIYTARTRQNEKRAGAIRAGSRSLRHHKRRGLLGVLGQDQGGRARSLRDGHQGSAAN